MPAREQVLAREGRWALPVALATLASFALLVAAEVVVRAISGDGQAEVLASAYEHRSAITASGALKTASFVLLVAPLVYLFRAAQARAPRVRGQLIGLIVAAPLFLAATSVFTVVATNNAASDFAAGSVKAEITAAQATDRCESDRSDDGGAFRDDFGTPPAAALRRCSRTEVADDAAENAFQGASGHSLAEGFGLGGRIGLAFALLYSSLWAMRTGLLTRFWGSLGMAMGVAALLLLIQFTFIWFLYFGLLVAGWVPGGRPPAWAAGEAIPWPTPGERAAAEMEADEGPIEGEDGEETELRKRKRKQRD